MFIVKYCIKITQALKFYQFSGYKYIMHVENSLAKVLSVTQCFWITCLLHLPLLKTLFPSSCLMFSIQFKLLQSKGRSLHSNSNNTKFSPHSTGSHKGFPTHIISNEGWKIQPKYHSNLLKNGSKP